MQSAILDKQTWICVSSGERQSMELLKKGLKIAQYITQCLLGTPLAVTFENSASEIRFSNGGRVIAAPNNPATLRGFSGHILLDECAFWERPEETWQAVLPFITSPYGGTKNIRIISTPNGKANFFWKLWENDNEYFKKKLTVYDIVKQGLNIDIEELKKSITDEDIFRQEYMCEPLDSDVSLFELDFLRQCTFDITPNYSKCATYIGVDIGRKHDVTSIATLKYDSLEKTGYITKVETLKNMAFEKQFEYISRIIQTENPRHMAIDASGIGMQLGEDLKKRFSCVKPLTFTANLKNTLFGDLKRDFSQSALKIRNDEKVIEDLHKIKRIISASGNILYSASRDEMGHADIATSIALANYAKNLKGITFMPIAF